ncbi:hypothetical protein BY996DRAFT_7032509 [Phakopsora pachyrhizi]|nr:hypothetical protein BY996DRAFT_7032509 [Phakopsora pachyrhizi]
MHSLNVLIILINFSFFFTRSSSQAPTNKLFKREFKLRSYPEYQISTGQAGRSKQAAEKVFVTPFVGINLANISKTDLDNLNLMVRESIEVEKNFNAAIDAAGGIKTERGTQLQAGKIANKVLKNQGAVTLIRIKVAQGKDKLESLVAAEKKLAHNIEIDEKSAGKPMKSFLEV